MLKNPLYFIAILSLVLPLTLGCLSIGGLDLPGASDTVPDVEGILADEYTGDAEIVEDYQPVEIPDFQFLQASAKFEVDPSNSAELGLDAGSLEDQVLSLSTSAGKTWTLTIPPFSLFEDVTIRISELKNIASPELGSIQTGLLLEPDGLHFASPATLSISGIGIEPETIILGGAQDGSAIDLTATFAGENGIQTTIDHFSIVYWDPLIDYEALKKRVKESNKVYGYLIRYIKYVLDSPLTIPIPPVYPLRCETDQNVTRAASEKQDEYIRNFMEPEQTLIRDLQIAQLNYPEINKHYDDAWKKLAEGLIRRLRLKLYRFNKTYSSNEEYYRTYGLLTHSVGRLAAISNLSEEASNVSIGFLNSWAKSLLNNYLKELLEKHDYTLIPLMISMDRELSLQGGDNPDFLNKVTKAATFTIQFNTEEITFLDDFGSLQWLTEGTARYSLLTKETSADSRGKYTAFRHQGMPGLPRVEMTSPRTFDTQMMIPWYDLCAKEPVIDVYILRFARDEETFSADGVPISFPGQVQNAFAASIINAAFSDKVVEPAKGWVGPAGYKFTIPLRNFNVLAGNYKETREIPDNTSTITITVKHTPVK